MENGKVYSIKAHPRFPNLLKWSGHGLFTGILLCYVVYPQFMESAGTFLGVLATLAGWYSFIQWYKAHNVMVDLHNLNLIKELIERLEKDGTFRDETCLTKEREEEDG